MNKNINKISIVNILILSILLFSGKWLASFILFNGENHILKIIEDSFKDSYMYFHYVLSLSEFDFSNIYSEAHENYKLKIAPIGTLITHSLFFKFIGSYSFILMEFISIFLFILIFYLIVREFNISNELSILLSLIFFCLPLLIQKLTFINIVEIQTFSNNFYNLRFPRPLISNLYLFGFILILIKNLKSDSFEKKYLIAYSILLALSLTSFFFIFILQSISLSIFLLFKYKKKIIINFINKKKELIIALVIFGFIIFPFLYLLKNVSSDYLERMGVINIDINQKKELIFHYFEKLTRLKIITLYITIFVLYKIVKVKFAKNLEIIKVFLIVFFSSMISPFIFVIFSSKISFLYHFNNLIVISSVLLILMMLVAIIEASFKKVQEFKNFKFANVILIVSLIYLYNYENVKYKSDKFIDKSRFERNELIQLINNNNKINLRKLNLLTFDTKIMTWAIINKVPYMKIIDGTYTPKNNFNTEKDLMTTFKFLNLNKDDLFIFLENKRIGYRYLNNDARKIFWQKYQANSLTSYKNSLDFDSEILEFIKKSSPFYAHQFAIPNNEINRLLRNFLNYNENENFRPDIILINKNKDFLKNYSIDETIYCNFYSGDYFEAFQINNLC